MLVNTFEVTILLLLIVLIAISYWVWRFSKNLGVTPKFRIYLIGTVVIIVIAICASLFIESCTDCKNNDTNNKEEIVIQL